MNKKGNNKGFTLIELLAVMIIISVLMVVAVPSISEYIINSKKETYISTVNGYMNGLKYKINNFEYSFSRKDTTYYVHIDNIPLEKGGKSPYGEWLDAYVVVTYNGSEHNYYWTSVDEAGYKIQLKKVEDITVDDIVYEEEKFVSTKRTVGNRDKIQIIAGNGKVNKDIKPAIEYTKAEASECFVYEIANGEVTINAYDNSCPKKVEVPSTIGGYPVTKIASYAFTNLGITEVILPEGLLTIGGSAFRSNNITKVIFSSTITSIGSEAFANNKLTELSFKNYISSIGSGAFTNNQIPEDKAFIYKQKSDGTTDFSELIGYAGTLKDVIIPERVNGVPLKTISSSAFRNLSLTSVVIPDTVETIGSFAFGSNRLTTVKLPSNLKTIQSAAFANNRLTSIDIPSSVTSISGRAFNSNYIDEANDDPYIYARKSNGSIDYSNIVSYAGINKNITIPSIKNGVALKTITASAFFGTGLKSVVIPDTVTSIGTNAFNANQLAESEAYIYKRKAGADGNAVIDYSTLIGYGGSNRGTVSNPIVVPQTVNNVDLKTIETYAFNENGIKGIILPDTVTTIKAYAFNACYLKEFTVPKNLTSFAANSMKKEVSWGNFNMLTKIINKSGRSFDWKAITAGRQTATFATGTIKHHYGDIIVTSE